MGVLKVRWHVEETACPGRTPEGVGYRVRVLDEATGAVVVDQTSPLGRRRVTVEVPPGTYRVRVGLVDGDGYGIGVERDAEPITVAEESA